MSMSTESPEITTGPVLPLRWSGGDDPESFGLARTEMRAQLDLAPRRVLAAAPRDTRAVTAVSLLLALLGIVGLVGFGWIARDFAHHVQTDMSASDGGSL